ncbi:MAG: recombinase family protein [Oscillospiraceae bacterium]|nr:recombinase family protein [Oscillospiraceae bacterium]
MKAVIYARYSSDNQREESIEGQLRECTEFAEKSGFTILQHYIDRAYSATTDNRPEFQRMIKDSDKRLFDVIIVWKLDRFSRNRYDSAKYKNQLNKNGVKVLSATESITDSPEGILMESLLEGWAEYYSKDLSVKVSRGLTENVINGKFNGGVIPPGYMVDDNQHIQIDPVKAPFVLEVFKRYDQGDTKGNIIKWLNENYFTNSKGTPMSFNTIGIMLKNRKYIGEYKFHDHINNEAIPPIVPKDLFEKVQMRLEKNKKAPAHFKAEEEYILSSKLVCGYCETYMCGESGTSHTGATYHYYKCMAVKKKKNNCKKKTVRKDWIENIVINEITKIIFDDDTIESIVSMVMKIQSEDNKEIPLYEKQLSSVQKSIDNTLNAIKMGIFTESTKQMLEELEQQKKYLTERIAVERLKKPMISHEKVRNWLYKLRTLNPEKTEHRRVLIDTFVNKIFLYDDKMIFTFNYKSDTKEVTFKELNGSDFKFSTAPQSR